MGDMKVIINPVRKGELPDFGEHSLENDDPPRSDLNGSVLRLDIDVYENRSSNKTRVSTALKVLGSGQIFSGLFMLILNVIQIVYASIGSYISYGIWGGILSSIAGAMGISISHKRTQLSSVYCMLASLIACAAALVVCGFGIGGIVHNVQLLSSIGTTFAAIDALVITAAILELIFSIGQACLLCYLDSPAAYRMTTVKHKKMPS